MENLLVLGQIVFILSVLSAFPAGCLFGCYLDAVNQGYPQIGKDTLKAGFFGIGAAWALILVPCLLEMVMGVK